MPAVLRIQEGLEQMDATLAAELPPNLAADRRVLFEGHKLLEAQLFRSLHSTLTPLYAAHHAGEISALAQTSHTMRTLLPCDLQIPKALWLVTPDDATLSELRECGPSEPRLPYAIAIQLLRTLTFYRSPEEKAKTLLEACEEVIKCATRALSLRAAGSLKASSSAAAMGADDLLPLLVYTVARSRVTSLPAELAFICDFLPPGQQHGKEGYALVSLQCACRVAQDLDWTSDSLLRPQAGRRE